MVPEEYVCPVCGRVLSSVSAVQACAVEDDLEDRMVNRRHGRRR